MRMILILGMLLFTVLSNTYSVENDSLKIRKNTIYVEFWGSTFAFYNLSYDRMLTNSNEVNISTGLGIQYIPNSYSYTPQLNIIFGKKHCFETGIALSIFYSTSIENPKYSYDFRCIPIRFGYRYQNMKNGLFIKAAYTPFLTDFSLSPIIIFGNRKTSREYFFMPIWGGFSVGYSF